MRKLKISPSKIFIIIAAAIVIILLLKLNNTKSDSDRTIMELRKSIIASDKLTKEADGRYAKLVNYYASEDDLKDQLKELNKDLYNTIKDQDERLMSITDAVITLESELTAGFGSIDTKDTTNVNLALKYPAKGDPFVFWNGKVNRYNAEYNGEFTFGKLPIQIVVTEESRGLWKHRIIGPEWLKVDSLKINSIPPEEYATVKAKKLQWIVGGNYSYSFSPTIPSAIGVGVGVNLFDAHNIIFGANSASQVNIGYYYKLKSIKRK
jgi:hypothetical protein